MGDAVFRGRSSRPFPLRPQKGEGDPFEKIPEGDERIGRESIAGVRFRYQLVPFLFRLALAHLGIEPQRCVFAAGAVAIEQNPHLALPVLPYLQTAMTLLMHVCPFCAPLEFIQV
ncbi:MAG: hypothetical protein ACREIC_23505 [Limisphaerales bacterium]